MNLENLVVLDVETFPNYFLVAFKNLNTNKTQYIELRGDGPLPKAQRDLLKKIMNSRVTFGFNSNSYDLPMILAAIKGMSVVNMKKLSDTIIETGRPGWLTMRQFGLSSTFEHFDIKEPAPGVMVSLKLYGGRLHSQRLQDLPFDPAERLTGAQMDELRDYCVNDLDTTIDLFNAIKPQMQLRSDMSVEYDQDLMSKSDAQIAEAVLKAALPYAKKPGEWKDLIKYRPPSYIRFKTPELRKVLTLVRRHRFELDGRGSVKLPDELGKQKLTIGSTDYKVGIGGLHSMEKNQVVVPGDGEALVDKDVASYYPSIILNLGLYPRHLKKKFLDVYGDIVARRLEAKAAGDKVVADSLKITINGSFGKLGSKYSALYSPDLMLAVTLTGQLSLLMLIERLELAGIKVVSANTDGFVSLVSDEKRAKYEKLCAKWEKKTDFGLEATEYAGLYSRDVNNYIAVKANGEVKTKGAFSPPSLMKNPTAPIVAEAVKQFVTNGVDPKQTITACKDVRKFIHVRTVKGGAVWRGEYLGKVVRWVYTSDGEPIRYKTNGNKVAKSEGATPVMELGDLPDRVDYGKYIEEAEDALAFIRKEDRTRGVQVC